MKKKLKPLDYENNDKHFFKKDSSPIVPQRSKLKYDLHVIERPDLTDKQKELINLIENKSTKMVIVSGPAGTTKSYLAIYCGLQLLNQKRVSDLIYVRSAVESASNSLGFLPGELEEKFSVYMEPLMDKLMELLPKNEIDFLKKENRIIGIPVNFLRGKNFNAQYIVIDEAQNLNFKEIVTCITRIGEYSKIILLGDPEQSDINGKSFFFKALNFFDDEESRENGIFTFRLTQDDILRSRLVKFIVNKLRKLTQ